MEQATSHLPDASLEKEIATTLETDASLEEGLERVALAVERVDDVRAGLDERRLEHVREEGEDRVERLEVLARRRVAVLDAREQLREDREVEDERRREQRILYTRSATDPESERSGEQRTSHSLKMLMVERPPQKISE